MGGLPFALESHGAELIRREGLAMIVWVQLRATALDSDRMARPQDGEKTRRLESEEGKKKKKSGETLEAGGDNYLSQAADKF